MANRFEISADGNGGVDVEGEFPTTLSALIAMAATAAKRHGYFDLIVLPKGFMGLVPDEDGELKPKRGDLAGVLLAEHCAPDALPVLQSLGLTKAFGQSHREIIDGLAALRLVTQGAWDAAAEILGLDVEALHACLNLQKPRGLGHDKYVGSLQAFTNFHLRRAGL